jgi:XTP/dITP diphosphohydrolase
VSPDPADRRRLLLATRARHKAEELAELLALPGVALLTPDQVNVDGEPVEDAETFVANALLKARWYAERSGLPTLADDSGLEVDALDGRPGVYTRRYAGPHASDAQNNARLLEELAGVPPERRTARYRCVLAFIDPPGAQAAGDHQAIDALLAEGTFEGRIASHPRGEGGFGYDPLFEPLTEPPGGRTVGQMSRAEKHALSHRGQAARLMARQLRSAGW